MKNHIRSCNSQAASPLVFFTLNTSFRKLWLKRRSVFVLETGFDTFFHRLDKTSNFRSSGFLPAKKSFHESKQKTEGNALGGADVHQKLPQCVSDVVSALRWYRCVSGVAFVHVRCCICLEVVLLLSVRLLLHHCLKMVLLRISNCLRVCLTLHCWPLWDGANVYPQLP